MCLSLTRKQSPSDYLWVRYVILIQPAPRSSIRHHPPCHTSLLTYPSQNPHQYASPPNTSHLPQSQYLQAEQVHSTIYQRPLVIRAKISNNHSTTVKIAHVLKIRATVSIMETAQSLRHSLRHSPAGLRAFVHLQALAL